MKDFIYLNVPAILSKKAWIAESSNSYSVDPAYEAQTRSRIAALISYFSTRNLLRLDKSLENLDQLQIMFSDFTDLGQKFIKTQAAERWLDEFDRKPGKSPCDVKSMDRKLNQLIKGGND